MAAPRDSSPAASTGDLRDYIDQVKKRVDIVQVIGERMPLDRRHTGLCPFHRERHPSLSVSPVGDVITFLQLHDGKPFLEVLRELGTQVGLPLPAIESGDRLRFEEARLLEDILARTAAFYSRIMTPEVTEYLHTERGLTAETVARHQIGYAHGGLAERVCRGPGCRSCGVVPRGRLGWNIDASWLQRPRHQREVKDAWWSAPQVTECPTDGAK